MSLMTRKPRKRVLLVEDDPYSEMAIGRVLSKIDPTIEVTWIKSVAEAEANIGRRHYDLIIADIFLDGESTGLDFWSQCESEYPEIPFVVTSGLPILEFFKTVGREAISPPYLPKPLDLEECGQLLGGFLGKSSSKKAGAL